VTILKITALVLVLAGLFCGAAQAREPAAPPPKCPSYVPKPTCQSQPVGPVYRLGPITLRDYLYWAVNGGMPSPDRKPRG